MIMFSVSNAIAQLLTVGIIVLIIALVIIALRSVKKQEMQMDAIVEKLDVIAERINKGKK